MICYDRPYVRWHVEGETINLVHSSLADFRSGCVFLRGSETQGLVPDSIVPNSLSFRDDRYRRHRLIRCQGAAGSVIWMLPTKMLDEAGGRADDVLQRFGRMVFANHGQKLNLRARRIDRAKSTNRLTVLRGKRRRREAEDEDEKCGVCLSAKGLGEWCTTRCGHEFHAVCLVKWLLEKQECSLCRTSFSEQDHVALMASAAGKTTVMPFVRKLREEVKVLRAVDELRKDELRRGQRHLDRLEQEHAILLQEHKEILALVKTLNREHQSRCVQMIQSWHRV